MSNISRIEFDGIILRFYDDVGNIIAHSLGVSGRPGSQNPSLQNVVNTGPLPEGSYTLRPSDIDYRDSALEYLAWTEGWGEGRVTLIPNEGTELHGRSGFFLHGSRGDNGYGSAGCIDLNGDDLRIFNLLQTQGSNEIEVIVDYSANRAFLETNSHPILDTDTPCFPCDTPILLADGSSKAIADVRVGDMVMAFDGFATLQPRRVVNLFRNTTDEWLELTFDDGREALTVTPGHRFLTKDGDFAKIKDLITNDNTAEIVLAA